MSPFQVLTLLLRVNLQLISIRGAFCVRGYWNTPNDVSKTHVLDWVEKEIEKIGLSDLKDTLYFPQSAGT